MAFLQTKSGIFKVLKRVYLKIIFLVILFNLSRYSIKFSLLCFDGVNAVGGGGSSRICT